MPSAQVLELSSEAHPVARSYAAIFTNRFLQAACPGVKTRDTPARSPESAGAPTSEILLSASAHSDENVPQASASGATSVPKLPLAAALTTPMPITEADGVAEPTRPSIVMEESRALESTALGRNSSVTVFTALGAKEVPAAASAEKDAPTTLSGCASPAPRAIETSAMGTSPIAEMRTIEVPGCVYLGLRRSNLTSVSEAAGSVWSGATLSTSVPVFCVHLADELKSAVPSRSLIVASGVMDPTSPEMVTVAFLSPVRSNCGLMVKVMVLAPEGAVDDCPMLLVVKAAERLMRSASRSVRLMAVSGARREGAISNASKFVVTSTNTAGGSWPWSALVNAKSKATAVKGLISALRWSVSVLASWSHTPLLPGEAPARMASDVKEAAEAPVMSTAPVAATTPSRPDTTIEMRSPARGVRPTVHSSATESVLARPGQAVLALCETMRLMSLGPKM
mmetsp:Transcript_41590/g.98623  ORF Transcript_41590/g.98623 Transcript_41590/m.98623 type:complete len:453 (-) Transcript_41590:966-2324(-)